MLNRINRRIVAFFAAAPAASIASTAFLLISGAALGLVFSTGLGHPFDKLFHGVFFALLTVSLSGFFGGRALPAALLTVFLGGGGELLQALLPHHDASLLDAAANVVGVLAAVGIMRLVPAGVSLPWHNLGFTDVVVGEQVAPVRAGSDG